MNRCPITYDELKDGFYSKKGLNLLNPALKDLKPFPYNKAEQLAEARKRMTKMSIQGIQPKMSAQLSIKETCFIPVDRHGIYILKPEILHYPEVPQNEDLSMRIATSVGIEVPLHGLIYAKDQSMLYFIRRFDRKGKKGKIHTEDFAQISAKDRDTKYNYSMEKVAKLIDEYCTFPAIEKVKLFRRTLLSFLIGNEDMHLKNFSIIHENGRISLSPAYDILNTWIVLSAAREELALTLKGKKSNFTRKQLINYYGKERLKLSDKIIDKLLLQFEHSSINIWPNLIQNSFLSSEMKEKYADLVQERFSRLFG